MFLSVFSKPLSLLSAQLISVDQSASAWLDAAQAGGSVDYANIASLMN